MIVMIDNYDSFTYNVVQYVSELSGEELKVFRNNKVTLEELDALNPDSLIISPGPGRPDGAGISLAAIKHFAGKIPLLGVCLGHQAIAAAFGGKIIGAQRIVHGKKEVVEHDGMGLFRGLPQGVQFVRYHSLAAQESSLPDCLEITSRTADGEIMGLRHKEYDIEGVQFHPESAGSDMGKALLRNFLKYHRLPFRKKEILSTVLAGKDLSQQLAAEFMDELTEGNLNPAYIAAVLVGLNCKGITAEEVAGCAGVLMKKKKHVKVPRETLDTCGTGGDGLETFNISSFSALIAASAGAVIAKHGNRAVSSRSGSAEFYRELGLPIEQSPQEAADSIEQEGFSFLFAPLFHGAMRHAGPVRQELGIKTIMNCLGPLVNPASASYQLIGVYEPKMLPIMARAARMLGVKRVMTLRGDDGLDEISLTTTTQCFLIEEDGTEKEFSMDPRDLGFDLVNMKDLKGGTGAENADQARELLQGKGKKALRDICVLNAGVALMVSGKAKDYAQGIKLAAEALDGGKTAALVKKLQARNKEA
ncbi:MAG: bifunctional anthranilate synthase component II/anthranilate phosphoribosyltransferase [Spirochaetaceae bacterium]|jgi:anthranilate synthase/phosphoribosyltransferase|nr:bifunctional anthranilate synthase component II/anthranilate phosphoribosyltransferase [Spirochaetaceae bacterium]